MKHKRIEWDEPWTKAFGKPEASGLWTICGHSGNGKTALALSLSKELSTVLGRGFFNTPEMGTRASLQDLVAVQGLNSPDYRRKILFGEESMEDMIIRFGKHKAPKWAIVDSYQATGLTDKSVKQFLQCYPWALLILILRAKGRGPETTGERKAWYHSDLKIWTEGFRGISHGRSNYGGEFTIWEKGASKYWGTKK